MWIMDVMNYHICIHNQVNSHEEDTRIVLTTYPPEGRPDEVTNTDKKRAKAIVELLNSME